MSGRRALALAVLGITWACVCLVIPPLVVNLLGPLVPGAPLNGLPQVASHGTQRPEPSRPSPDLDGPRRIDLYGNEISSPVARYRVDPRGTLYEVHSPDTEVARLAPPRL
jgi:hypothetical protein